MIAETVHNPWWRNPSVRPCVVIYRDVPFDGPPAMRWKAMVAAAPQADGGFPIHAAGGRELHTLRLEDMLYLLRAAGWDQMPIYRRHADQVEPVSTPECHEEPEEEADHDAVEPF